MKEGRKMEVKTKYYKQGYNNPSQFDESKLLNSNSKEAKQVLEGICQRKEDEYHNCVKFK